MRLSRESIPALSGEACRLGSLLGAAGGRPTSGMSGKPPFSSLILNESLCRGWGRSVCPFHGDSSESPSRPSPFFLIKIRNDRPERQRAKGAMAEIALIRAMASCRLGEEIPVRTEECASMNAARLSQTLSSVPSLGSSPSSFPLAWRASNEPRQRTCPELSRMVSSNSDVTPSPTRPR